MKNAADNRLNRSHRRLRRKARIAIDLPHRRGANTSSRSLSTQFCNCEKKYDEECQKLSLSAARIITRILS